MISAIWISDTPSHESLKDPHGARRGSNTLQEAGSAPSLHYQHGGKKGGPLQTPPLSGCPWIAHYDRAPDLVRRLHAPPNLASLKKKDMRPPSVLRAAQIRNCSGMLISSVARIGDFQPHGSQSQPDIQRVPSEGIWGVFRSAFKLVDFLECTRFV